MRPQLDVLRSRGARRYPRQVVPQLGTKSPKSLPALVRAGRKAWIHKRGTGRCVPVQGASGADDVEPGFAEPISPQIPPMTEESAVHVEPVVAAVLEGAIATHTDELLSDLSGISDSELV